MRFRLKAFLLHLSGSACALALVLGGLYLGWYRWPGWYLTGVLRILIIVLIVDLALGPTITFIIANPQKPRRALARDIAIVVAVQIIALMYGATTLWKGRPLYYTFSVDRIEMVQASDIEEKDALQGWQQRPDLAPHWYSRPRWVWAPLPQDPEQANKIVNSTIFGGQDVIDMPRFFKPWSEGLPELSTKLQRVDDVQVLSRTEKQDVKRRMQASGAKPEEANVLIMWGNSRRLIAVFDPAGQRIKALLTPN